MPPRRGARRFPTPPTPDEVLSIHELSDDSVAEAPAPARPARGKAGAVKSRGAKAGGSASARKPRSRKPPQPAIELSDSADEAPDGEEMEMDEVDVSAAGPSGAAAEPEEEDMEMEEVPLDGGEGEADYSAAYAVAEAARQPENGEGAAATPAIFHDGKGQAAGVISLNLGGGSAAAGGSKAKRAQNENRLTPRDRAVRLASHKLGTLAMLAHAKVRNSWANDDPLKDALYDSVPQALRTKLKLIHPKRVANVRERVRMFEAFMRDLVVWWAHRRFRLEPNMTATAALRQPNPDALAGAFPPPGGRVDGWVVESAAERDERWRQERAQRQAHARELAARSKQGGASRGKGKEKAIDVDAAPKAPRQACPDITLFGPGANNVTPRYLHLAPSLELIISPESLLERHEARNGSRETSAQLFCSMCRALGIPARLVISVQVAPWSIGAAKVATTAGAIEKKPKRGATGTAKLPKAKQIQENRKPEGEYTSDEDEWELGDGSVAGSAKSPAVTPVKARAGGRQAKGKAANGTASRPASIAGTASGTESVAHRSDVELSAKSKRSVARSSVAGSAAASPAQLSKTRKAGTSAAKGQRSRSSSLSSADGDASTSVAGDASKGKSSKGKAKDQAEDEEDPRARWANGPIEVEHVPRLRRTRPKKLKATELEADAVSDVEVVDTEAPPTMWVEVFSKPWQKWLTVDPVRGRLEPAGNRHMEPAPSDRTNRLVYVVAFEEDGFARDVTARYTKTLHSRVSRMRPPPIGKGAKKDAWWASVIAALHRPQHLDRDAAEDVELEEAAGKEPMPSSVGGFKDHPVFAIEKHLKRDEVIHPLHQIGTFQGIKVYPRSNVVSCRSARQWYNEGRVVSDGQEALKWVKSRGYTLANKRAEEQARAEGGESPMEGLYAEYQTELYQAPPVVDGEVPKNSFGNIDLFVPTMLPAGAAHIPYNGAGKVAKKLGISYAEAITGFEFRKFRSMPRLTGIVVPEEYEDLVAEAYWESEHAAAEKEFNKRQERAMKNWKKMLNALRIAQRVKEQYGADSEHAQATSAPKQAKRGAAQPAVADEVSKLRALEEDAQAMEEASGADLTASVGASDADELMEVAAAEAEAPKRGKIVSLAALASKRGEQEQATSTRGRAAARKRARSPSSSADEAPAVPAAPQPSSSRLRIRLPASMHTLRRPDSPSQAAETSPAAAAPPPAKKQATRARRSAAATPAAESSSTPVRRSGRTARKVNERAYEEALGGSGDDSDADADDLL